MRLTRSTGSLPCGRVAPLHATRPGAGRVFARFEPATPGGGIEAMGGKPLGGGLVAKGETAASAPASPLEIPTGAFGPPPPQAIATTAPPKLAIRAVTRRDRVCPVLVELEPSSPVFILGPSGCQPAC